MNDNIPYDGPNDEWIKVKCVECGDGLSGPRRNIKLGRDERDEGWKIERGEHGEIVATCGAAKMKRINWLRIAWTCLVSAIVITVIVGAANGLQHLPYPETVVDTDWRQIAIGNKMEGELQSEPPSAGNPSSRPLAASPKGLAGTMAGTRRSPQVEPVTADSKGQPRRDEASSPLYERLSDRAKEGMWTTGRGDERTARFASIAVTAASSFVLTTRNGITERGLGDTVMVRSRLRGTPAVRRTDDIRNDLSNDTIRAKGREEIWSRSANAQPADNRVGEQTGSIARSMMTTDVTPATTATTVPPPQYPMPCHLPAVIRSDGLLAEPCDPATGRPLSAASTAMTTAAVHAVHTAAVTDGASSITAVASRRPAVNPPEAPIICPSDALGAVTAKWNAVSVDWYRKSQSYPPDSRLPWLFQCRGDLVERASADASKDPSAAHDIMGWLLTWLFEHGVVSHEVSAWHHFTVERPADAAGVTEVVVQFNDGWLRPGEIDRDGMNGEVYADPDCSQCEVWFFAPMMPGVATVTSWGKQ